ncbi:hypothetical protein IFM89_000462 [Coptis chinensis]|uniref:AP2/ERF domain-containing protein n=1 Tax=Coptis chinensis TaxID=261450 RepID=A0A835LFU3_9MAGN|nr:hypothetical protein IFM89_000462 [Coptis chinensis]
MSMFKQDGTDQTCTSKLAERSTINSTKGRRFLGVRQRPSGRWVAEIKDSSQKLRVWLGTYDKPEDAAMAYDNAAWLLRGKNAKTNFPYSEIMKTQEGYCNLVGKNPRFCQLLTHAITKKNHYYNKTSSIINSESARVNCEKEGDRPGSVGFNSFVEETIVCSSSSSSDEELGCYGFQGRNRECSSFGGCKVYSSVIVAPSFSTCLYQKGIKK